MEAIEGKSQSTKERLKDVVEKEKENVKGECMKINEGRMELHNVVKYYGPKGAKLSTFEEMEEVSDVFKKSLMQNGFFTSGPVILVEIYDEIPQFYLMTTLGNRVQFTGSKIDEFSFEEKEVITTPYYYRHFDNEEEIPYDALEAHIKKDGKVIQEIYYVGLEMYGIFITDMYIIAKEVS